MAQERTRSLARVAADRIRQDRGLGVLTAVAMVAFVVLVYVVVVIGFGALLGRTGSPSLWLSVLATAIVAIGFEPVRRAVHRRFSRALGQDRISPYQVLARFPSIGHRCLPGGGTAGPDGHGAGRGHRHRTRRGLAGGARPAGAGGQLACRIDAPPIDHRPRRPPPHPSSAWTAPANHPSSSSTDCGTASPSANGENCWAR